MLNLKNTLDGYLKNVEVIGNTVQDTNNLANIRSVGDKVEGQELYKISIQVDNGEGVSEVVEILSPVQLEKVGNVVDRIVYKDGVWGIEKNIFKIPFTSINIKDHFEDKGKTYKGGVYYKDILSDNVLAEHFVYGALSTESSRTQICVHNHGGVAGREIRFAFLKSDFPNITNINSMNTHLQSLSGGVRVVKQPQFIPLPHDQQVKLRTFAGQTNIAFLTEIVGQIKAQVPKSLGATVNTHTEQIADLHNSLDRVKKLEETTVSTIETGSSFTTVDATSNGYFEDVKLEGKTLVNLLGTQGMGVITLDTSGNRSKKFINVNHLNGKIYTIVFNITRNSNDIGVFLNHYTNAYNSVHTVKICNGGTIGLISTTLTLGNNYDNELNMYIQAGSSGVVEIEDVLLLEGDHTNNPPEYFEGLMSVGQDVEEVSVVSCDFMDITEFELGGFNGEGYPVENDARVRTSNYIPYANTKLKLGMLGSQEAEIVFYNKDKTKLSNIAWVKDGDIVAVPNNTQYVRVALRYPNDVVIYPSDIKYFKMSCPKDKKPLLYYNPTTETWEKPILREWDTIEKHSDGKYYYHKRSGEVVLNGSESWNIYASGSQVNTKGFDFVLAEKKVSATNISFLIANRFNNVSADYSYSNDVECICTSSNKIRVRIGISKLSTQDVAGFKAWLKANPTTIVYQLAQEEVYECTNIDLMTYSGETNYIINSGAISPKSLLKVHNNISNVVKILQEKVSLLENTFIAGLKSVLSGDMYSLATILYPEDFEQNDNTEQDIMVIPE